MGVYVGKQWQKNAEDLPSEAEIKTASTKEIEDRFNFQQETKDGGSGSATQDITKEQYGALKAGSKYWHNGKQYTKKATK